MQNITLDTITQAVINHGDRAKSHPRLYEIYTSLIQHLHEFVREVNLTEPELQQGRNFLNQASHHTQEIPTGEIHLLTDLVGSSELVELLHDTNRGTESNLEGLEIFEAAEGGGHFTFIENPEKFKLLRS